MGRIGQPFGSILAAIWTNLGSYLEHLGALMSLLETIWSFIEFSNFCRPCEIFWEPFGIILETMWDVLEHWGHCWEQFGFSLSSYEFE